MVVFLIYIYTRLYTHDGVPFGFHLTPLTGAPLLGELTKWLISLR